MFNVRQNRVFIHGLAKQCSDKEKTIPYVLLLTWGSKPHRDTNVNSGQFEAFVEVYEFYGPETQEVNFI